MKKNMHVYYDEEGDLLEIRIGKPAIGYLKDLGKDIFERIDEKTGKINGFLIFNFKKRSEKSKPIDVPLPVELKIAA